MASENSSVSLSSRIQALFSKNLDDVGDISTAQFERTFSGSTAPKKHIGNLGQVDYFDMFMSDPAVINAETQIKVEEAKLYMTSEELSNILNGTEHHELRKSRQFDFRLNAQELQKLQETGMYITERFQVHSFGEGYYRTYTDDLPVYITADSVLHAWHLSYDAILKGVEAEVLKPHVEQIVNAAIDTIHDMKTRREDFGRDYLECLDELEYYLGVGAKLLVEPGSQLGNASYSLFRQNLAGVWNQEAIEVKSDANLTPAVQERVEATLNWIKLKEIKDIPLFQRQRDVDFSLFEPRGSYTTSQALKNYFRAMMWYATIDFRFGGKGSSEFEFLCSLVFSQVIKEAHVLKEWQEMDDLITALVGEPDSMTFKHFFALTKDKDLNACLMPSSCNVESLRDLRNQIIKSGVGKQAITGHPLELGELIPDAPAELPHSFTFIGQRFLIDSFVLSTVVYDKIMHQGKKVVRRIPSGLDVAFTVFGNDATVQEIASRMTYKENDSDLVKFRDGFNYSSNLTALRMAVDQLEPAYISSSILMRWLGALKELSKPASHSSWTLHSSEWKMKTLATQLASWAQLRHDNLLYIKQGFSLKGGCEYPAGFVDPYPTFWREMKGLAIYSLTQLSKSKLFISSFDRLSRAKEFLEHFADVMGSLETISEKQAANETLSEEENLFLKTVMEEPGQSGPPKHLGWYPGLFYKVRGDATKVDYVVADVHSDPPDPVFKDPGSVLHVGVGDVLTAFIIVEFDKGKQAMFAGPVFSYYEFLMPYGERLSDQAWRVMVSSGKAPAMPSWASFSRCE